ncbi:hypothetical protein [Fulvivirga sediminis]|uniref:Uncharacterized protein n=1 Tax=Fulvivirga sediminis TaxID=2803949 RepID=A0A937K0Z9_9BACT|nr:hypothetical protein [Fulvivirga sediminis]MBL3656921.1 hypothetical protein [Fulvivirga sediminis]
MLEYNDMMFNINFVIDKNGHFNSFDIREMRYFWDEKGREVKEIVEKDKGLETDMKKNIMASILQVKDDFLPALINNTAANAKINLQLRLISE